MPVAGFKAKHQQRYAEMYKKLKIKSQAEARGGESAGLIDFRGRDKRAADGDAMLDDIDHHQ